MRKLSVIEKLGNMFGKKDKKDKGEPGRQRAESVMDMRGRPAGPVPTLMPSSTTGTLALHEAPSLQGLAPAQIKKVFIGVNPGILESARGFLADAEKVGGSSARRRACAQWLTLAGEGGRGLAAGQA